ncbi:TAXI family TRAP transporter solute-binding subunit [Falsibacillus albus]|uniref:TAXI family TRAP transporter solute-binding subunit n=1 Tax=Falsibacillus albus TaxID=2478915 RepID=A0A3L7K2B9_9BACI|nr:TAXI family TRAP transporter solute-binding subunit [Falsibacillus albus]RLQ97153.1 TAXI family TRAP transporter solute-binding subunit [Falsibacillus albus]
MKRRSFFLGTAIVLALSLLLAACGGEKDGSGKVKFISLATGGTGGTYYPLGGTFAKLIQDETGIDANAITSGASAENMASLKKKKVEVAFTQSDIASYATKGELMFKDNKVDNVQAIGTLYPETIQIVTSKKSGIKSVEDLKGKVVSVGEAGSGTLANAEQILEVYGLKTDDLKARNLSFDDSAQGIQDGTIDAAFITSGAPTGAVEGLSATTPVNIIALDDDKMDDLIKKYPYYAKDVVKSGTYGLEEDVPTVAVRAMLVVRSDLSKDMVYKMTKAIFDHTDKITNKKEYIKAENALQGLGIELHPGAKKYFDEKGIKQ